MELSLTKRELVAYVIGQTNAFFPDGRPVHQDRLLPAFDVALDRLDFCFKPSAIPHYFFQGESRFNHLYSNQYAIFLWFLANSLWQQQSDPGVLDKLFCLNKALHGFECSYSTALPDVFFLSHTVGIVLGKATYGNYLVVSQGCTVGSQNGKYPVLGRGVALGSDASIIGNCHVGDRVSVGSNTLIFAQNLPSDQVAYRDRTGVLIVRPATTPLASQFFTVELTNS
ncbi:MAG: hypothetical protein NVS2B7_39280 [Herpetosiphon sp.]